MNRHRYPAQQTGSSGEKAQLVFAYQELGKELHSTHLKVIGNYTLGRVIGEGSFGNVRLGVHRLTGSRVAIKHIPKSACPPLLTREIHHHRRLHHPNVVQLYEVIATEHSIWLITELCAGGELFDYLVENTRFTEHEARRIFGQICLGLGYIHHQGVVHRDLKLENVLLDERCNPKIADFGFGREFEPRKLLDTFCGTTGYAAPEMLAGRKYWGEEVDIWSLGVILHTLLTGSLPFDDDDEEVMKTMIMTGEFEVPSFLSVDASDLIKDILKQEPKARPSIQQILSHSWFTLPPSQHSFPEDPSLRHSTIAEECPVVFDSPANLHSSHLLSDPNAPSSSLPTPQVPSDCSGSNPKANFSHPANHSDTSDSSFKDSDVDTGSGRSSATSLVISEDPAARTSDRAVLNSPSVSSAAALPGLSALPEYSAKPAIKPQALILTHRNRSNSTIKNFTRNSGGHRRSSVTRATCLKESDEMPDSQASDQKLQVSEAQASLSKQAPEPPSNTSAPAKGSNAQLRPLSIIPCLPSTILHPQIRTPSRTKRRSIGSTMSERAAPIDDLVGQGDLATPTCNQSRLSASALSVIVIDYLGALKATHCESLMSEQDLDLLKSLSALGFDTGQIIHSVQSNACDSSGAMWWLIKRKMEKQAIERELSERAAHRTSCNSGGDHVALGSNALLDSLDTPNLSINKPLGNVPASGCGDSARSPSSVLSSSRTSSLAPSALRGSETLDDAVKKKPCGLELPPIKDYGLDLAGNCSPPWISADSSSPAALLRKKAQLSSLGSALIEDAHSSTHSLRFDNSPDKDTSGTHATSGDAQKSNKLVQRKRSQSVSMLQRATHALAPKKTLEDKQVKARSREASSTGETEGSEKVSRKDLKAREKESRAHEETSKTLPSMHLSVLFSRKTVTLPPIPPIPLSVSSTNPSANVDGSCIEPGALKGCELEIPQGGRNSLSVPCSPSKSGDALLAPRRDSDPTHPAAGEAPDHRTLPALTTSASPSAPKQATHGGHMDPFSTPKPSSQASMPPHITPASQPSVHVTSAEPGSAHASASRAQLDDVSRSASSERSSLKVPRPKGNLFSTFRFWFNEDRRKRKRNPALDPNYGGPPNLALGRSGNRSSNHASGKVTPHLPSPSGESANQKLADLPLVWSGPSSAVPVHRQTSRSSRRSSLQSGRHMQTELHRAASGKKRRSGSSRASFGSLGECRTPTSEKGSFHSNSQYAQIKRTSLDGSRGKRPPGHNRQASTSSGGSRRSNVLAHVGHHVIPGGHPGFVRRTSSTGTTVRRITTSSVSKGNQIRRNSKTFSSGSSARTSVSSDEGSSSMNRSLSGHDDHRRLSPLNGYDLDETIEEEADGEGEEHGNSWDNQALEDGSVPEECTQDARRSALEKLSGDGTITQARASLATQGSGRGRNENGQSAGTRTIFMAHKPHSVFGTPTQAFFNRSTNFPTASKSDTAGKVGPSSSGSSPGSNYTNIMKSIVNGPLSRAEPKLRDVFASKVGEDGEWMDVQEEDDVCTKYGGGIGQSVRKRRGERIELVGNKGRSGKSGELMDKQVGSELMKLIDENQEVNESGKALNSPALGVMSKFQGHPFRFTSEAGHTSSRQDVKEGEVSKKAVRKLITNAGDEQTPHGVSSDSTIVGATASKISMLSTGTTADSPPQSNLIGNWRGGNRRVLANLKSAAIEEEEEEDE